MLNTEARQSARPSEGEFREGIREIYAQLKKEASMQAGLQSCEDALLKLLDARLFTVYERVANGKVLRAVFRGGDASGDEAAEIKVPFSATSIAGYVALSQEAILVRDVNDTEEVADIHPRLQFDRRFSDARGLEIRSMCAVPIPVSKISSAISTARPASRCSMARRLLTAMPRLTSTSAKAPIAQTRRAERHWAR